MDIFFLIFMFLIVRMYNTADKVHIQVLRTTLHVTKLHEM